MSKPIHIRVITSFYNIFERTFQPPIPVMKVKVSTEDLGVTDRSVLELDGSESTDDGSISTWDWTMMDASRTQPAAGNWEDTGRIVTSYLNGKTVRFYPNASAGPFRIRVKVTDDTGLFVWSPWYDVPRNPSFNPVVNLDVRKMGDGVEPLRTTWLNVTATDIQGNPMEGVSVSFLKLNSDGTLEFKSPSFNVTGIEGQVILKYEGNGTVRVISNNLPTVDKLVLYDD
jgi:hypothetical protein